MTNGSPPMPYDIEGETLRLPDIIARCATDTRGRPLNQKTVTNRVSRGHRTWAQLREPASIGRLRGKENYRGWKIREKGNGANC